MIFDFFKKKVKEGVETNKVKEGVETNKGYKIFKIRTKFMLNEKTYYFVSTEEWVTFVNDKLEEYNITVPNFQKWLFSFFSPDYIDLAEFLKKNSRNVRRFEPDSYEGECVYMIYSRSSVRLGPGHLPTFEVLYTFCYKNKLIYKTETRAVTVIPTIKLK